MLNRGCTTAIRMMPKKGIRRLQRGQGANSVLLTPAMLPIEQNPRTTKKGRKKGCGGGLYYVCLLLFVPLIGYLFSSLFIRWGGCLPSSTFHFWQ